MEGFLSIEALFESAKLHHNESEFNHVLDRIREVKLEILEFQAENQKNIDLKREHNFMDRVALQIDRIASYKVNQVLNEIGQEILGFQAGISKLVSRHFSDHIESIINLEAVKYDGLNQIGLDAQKILDEALKSPNNATALHLANAQVQTKLDQIIATAEDVNGKVVHQYGVELLKLNLVDNQDLNLPQKFMVARLTSMLSYIADYTRSLKTVVAQLLK